MPQTFEVPDRTFDVSERVVVMPDVFRPPFGLKGSVVSFAGRAGHGRFYRVALDRPHPFPSDEVVVVAKRMDRDLSATA